MTSPVQQIQVECPACRHRFTTFYRSSINLSLGDMTEKDVERNAFRKCPKCKHGIILDALAVEEDGMWSMGSGEEP